MKNRLLGMRDFSMNGRDNNLQSNIILGGVIISVVPLGDDYEI